MSLSLDPEWEIFAFPTGFALAQAGSILSREGIPSRIISLLSSESGCGRGIVVAIQDGDHARGHFRAATIPFSLSTRKIQSTSFSLKTEPVTCDGPHLKDYDGLVKFFYEHDPARVQPLLSYAGALSIDNIVSQEVSLFSGCTAQCSYCPYRASKEVHPRPSHEVYDAIEDAHAHGRHVWLSGGEGGDYSSLPLSTMFRTYWDCGPVSPGLYKGDEAFYPVINFRFPGDHTSWLKHPRSYDDYKVDRPFVQNIIVEVPSVSWEDLASLIHTVAQDPFLFGFRVMPFIPVPGTPFGMFAAACTFSMTKVIAALRILCQTVDIWIPFLGESSLINVSPSSGLLSEEDGPLSKKALSLFSSCGANGTLILDNTIKAPLFSGR